jgi:hypothetical protein
MIPAINEWIGLMLATTLGVADKRGDGSSRPKMAKYAIRLRVYNLNSFIRYVGYLSELVLM